jgi:D-alanyl-D-alanine dipeptidase
LDQALRTGARRERDFAPHFAERAQSRGTRARVESVPVAMKSLAPTAPVRMPGLYDEMSGRSFPTYQGGTLRQRALRDLLRVAMETAGFEVNDTEWWHFDFAGWREYPIMNVDFEDLR